jgi:tRNA G46 methylase TrmB
LKTVVLCLLLLLFLSILRAPFLLFSKFTQREGVVRFYNRIATHFVKTRHTPWPKVSAFASAVTAGQTVLDVGCGNGRHMVGTNVVCF